MGSLKRGQSDFRLNGPRTRRGGRWLFVAVVAVFLAVFFVMLSVALPLGPEEVRHLFVKWAWIVGGITVGAVLLSLVWIRYRLLELRLRLSGVRGRFLVGLIGADEKAALADAFKVPTLSTFSGIGIVITVDRDAVSVWHRVGPKPLGVIAWSEIDSISAVDTVNASQASPKLVFMMSTFTAPLSMAVLSPFPWSLGTLGFARIEKLAAKLRAEGGISQSDNAV